MDQFIFTKNYIAEIERILIRERVNLVNFAKTKAQMQEVDKTFGRDFVYYILTTKIKLKNMIGNRGTIGFVQLADDQFLIIEVYAPSQRIFSPSRDTTFTYVDADAAYKEMEKY